MNKIDHKYSFSCLFCLISLLEPQFLHAQILEQEIVVEYKEAEKFQPHVQVTDDNIRIVSEPKKDYKYYNMLEEMDLYSLSPYAKLLLLPHMASYSYQFDLDDTEVDWKTIIKNASARHNVAENLIYAVIKTESNFIADALSHVGAQGAMQIMPETAKDLGLTEPYNPVDNVDAGTRYLKEQLLRFNDLKLALAAYNAGPGNVIKYQGIPPFKETQDFVQRVLSRM